MTSASFAAERSVDPGRKIGEVSRNMSNPFSTCNVRPGAIRYQPADDKVDQLDSLVGRVRQHCFALIVGPHGSGKSTLIETLMPELRDRFTHITSVRTNASTATSVFGRLRDARQNSKLAHDRLARADSGGLLIVDGIEQLSATGRQSLVRKARRAGQSVLATSHAGIRQFVTIYRTTLTPQLVSRLTRSLLGHADDVSDVVLKDLDQRDLSGLTNLRELWFELYDVVEDMRSRRVLDEPLHTQR